MPEWGVVLLSIAGALILMLCGVVGSMITAERKREGDEKTSLSQTMADGFARLESLIVGVDTRARNLEKDCVTWADFDKLKADVTQHSTEIAIIKTTCASERSK